MTRTRGLHQPSGPPARLSELAVLARGSSLTLASVVVNALAAFAFVAVISRVLRVQGAGVIFEAIALFTICANVCDLGASTGLVRLLPARQVEGKRAEVRTLVRLGLIPPVVLAVVVASSIVVFAPQLAEVFVRGASRSTAVADIRVLAAFLPLGVGTTVALGASRGFGTMVPSAWIGNVSVPVLRLLIVPIAISLGAGGVALAVAWGLPLALGALASAFVLARLLGAPSRVGPGVTRRLAGEFWRFSSPRGLAGVFQVTVMWLDVLLVGALLSSQKAGIYTVASRYAVIGTLGLSAAGSAIAPQISRLFAQHRHTEAQDLFRSSTLWIVALAWPVLLIMAVFAPALMGAFGHGFSSGAGALSVLAGAMLWLTGTGNSGIALLMTGRSWYTFAITALSVSVNIGLNLVLIPRLGIVGAAWAWAATIVVANGLTVAALAWVSGISPFGTGYLAVGGAALALFGGGGLVARLAVGARLPVMIWFTAAASAAYATALWRARDVLHIEAFTVARRPTVRSLAVSGGAD